jgi:hypothetical protein
VAFAHDDDRVAPGGLQDHLEALGTLEPVHLDVLAAARQPSAGQR